MTKPLSSRIESLLDTVLTLPSEERTRYMIQACAGDTVLMRELEELVRGYDRAAVLDTPIADLRHAIAARDTAVKPAFAAGERIAGRFDIIRFVAQGGMGEVYEAEDTILHERVAIKTVRADIAAKSEVLERFKRETRLAHRVTHPNVCRIFDVGTHDTTLFLTMEFLDGESLFDRLRRSGPMTTAEALPLVKQIAGALAAAHKTGIVHRDLTSGNVILVPAADEEGGVRAIVTDFGLARTHAGTDVFTTGVGTTVFGTPAYMAPEQVAGEHVTPAADIYALGVVMFEMLTGRFPFAGDSPGSIARKRLTEAAPSPRQLVRELDARWEAAIARCLARDPRERFTSATDVVRALGNDATR